MTLFLTISSRRDFVSKFLLLLYHARFIEKSEKIYWSFFFLSHRELVYTVVVVDLVISGRLPVILRLI